MCNSETAAILRSISMFEATFYTNKAISVKSYIIIFHFRGYVAGDSVDDVLARTAYLLEHNLVKEALQEVVRAPFQKKSSFSLRSCTSIIPFHYRPE